MMMIEPVNDNIVVKLPAMDKEQKTNSGLVIANTTGIEVKADRGEIVAVGQGRISANGSIVPMNVEQGDFILFNRFAGTEVIIGEDKYLIIKECDILAKIK